MDPKVNSRTVKARFANSLVGHERRDAFIRSCSPAGYLATGVSELSVATVTLAAAFLVLVTPASVTETVRSAAAVTERLSASLRAVVAALVAVERQSLTGVVASVFMVGSSVSCGCCEANAVDIGLFFLGS